jgi:hypothetical protein
MGFNSVFKGLKALLISCYDKSNTEIKMSIEHWFNNTHRGKPNYQDFKKEIYLNYT